MTRLQLNPIEPQPHMKHNTKEKSTFQFKHKNLLCILYCIIGCVLWIYAQCMLNPNGSKANVGDHDDHDDDA